MKPLKIAVFLCLLFAVSVSAQTRNRTSSVSKAPTVSKEIRATPAYAEVVLRRVELQSELEELLVAYTREFPRVQEKEFELGLIRSEIVRFAKMRPAEAPKMTLALGKLIVRRATLATDFMVKSKKYGAEHPAVKKAKKRTDIFDEAINELLK